MTMTALDPVTFEVIRHRLWAINDDQGRMAARMSASPTVFDAYDFNSALITADGRGLYTRRVHHAPRIHPRRVRAARARGPGRRTRSARATCSSPTTRGGGRCTPTTASWPCRSSTAGPLVAWSGVVMHDTDVGSPVSSSFVVGARDRFGEAPLFPAIKLVENFVIREDIERVILRNSRTPADNALNMRARVGALTATHQRISELIGDYGLDAFLAAAEGILDYVERVLRAPAARRSPTAGGSPRATSTTTV